MTPNPQEAAVLSVLPAMSRLNAWARLPYEQQLGMSSAAGIIYRYKGAILGMSIQLRMAELRIVAVERSCKTCGGTGQFKRRDRHDEDYYELEDCRRCGATGKVVLRFVESRIHGFSWHTPRPKWDLGVFGESDWEKAAPTEWTPEQPGAPLERLELFSLLNTAERLLFGGRTVPRLREHYQLNLGTFESCALCGSGASRERYRWEIYRPGMKWRQDLCNACERTDAWLHMEASWPANLRWPARDRDLFPRWHDYAQLPEIARHPDVKEWLARRGVVEGYLPARDYGVIAGTGDFVRVERYEGSEALYRIANSEHWLYDHAGNGPLLRAPASQVWGRTMRLLS